MKFHKIIKKHIQRIELAIIVLLTIGFITKVADTYQNHEVTEKYLYFSSDFFLWGALLVFFLLRLYYGVLLPRSIVRFNQLVLFPLLIVASAAAIYVNNATHANYIFNHFRINIHEFYYLALGSGALMLLTLSNKFYQKHWRILTTIAPLVIFSVMLGVWFLPMDLFQIMTHEDHLIEILQIVVLFAGSVYSGFIAYQYYLNKNYILSGFFIICAIALFLVAGDEFSWGQRLLGIDTPESIQAVNRQGEITFHNISIFERYVQSGYILIGFYGMTAWLVLFPFRKILTQKLYSILAPRPYLFFFFFFGYFYNTRTNLDDHFLVWAEPAELMLYTAICGHMMILYHTEIFKNKRDEIR